MQRKLKILIDIIATLLSIFYIPSIAVLFHRINNKIYSKYVSRKFLSCGENLYIDSSAYILGHNKIAIAECFQAFPRLRLEAIEEFDGQNYEPSITIGSNVSINSDCHIGAINQIVIGNGVLIGSKVLITDHSHGRTNFDSLSEPPVKRMLFSKGPVLIEDNVWIGEGVAILPGVQIGRNAIIGANSVVVRDVPENAVVAGNPACVIRQMK
jgi:acetyltransferase-like isoleucine patch superfamily enzyme